MLKFYFFNSSIYIFDTSKNLNLRNNLYYEDLKDLFKNKDCSKDCKMYVYTSLDDNLKKIILSSEEEIRKYGIILYFNVNETYSGSLDIIDEAKSIIEKINGTLFRFVLMCKDINVPIDRYTILYRNVI